MDKLMEEIKKGESQLKTKQEITILQKLVSQITQEEIQKKTEFVKQKYFESANQPGRLLAYQLRKERTKRQIGQLKIDEKIIKDSRKIKKIFQDFYSNLHDETKTQKNNMDKYIKKVNIPKIEEKQQKELNTFLRKK